MIPVFDRVTVNFMVTGGTIIQWLIDTNFIEPQPWVFQLQEAESDVPGANWTNVGSPVTNAFMIVDTNRYIHGKEFNAFYRVELTTSLSNVYYSTPANVLGNITIRQWRWAREIVRKENLRLQGLNVGVNGWLLKALKSGTVCPISIDRFTNEVTDSDCATCYGIGFTGGYYNPVPTVFCDVNASMLYFQRDLEGGEGMVLPEIVEGMFVASPYIATNDVWVNNSSDLRYRVHQVDVRTHVQGVPILSKVTLRPIPTDNIVYQFPISRPDPASSNILWN